MHSSRMRTVCLLTVFQHALPGVNLPRGVPATGGVPAWGCTCRGACTYPGVYLPRGVYLPILGANLMCCV